MNKLIIAFGLFVCSFAFGEEPSPYRNVPLLSTCKTIAGIEAKNGSKLKGGDEDIIVFLENKKTIFYRCSRNNWMLSVDEVVTSEGSATKKAIGLAKKLEKMHGLPISSPSDIGLIDNIEILLFRNSAKELLKRSWIWKLPDRSIFVSFEQRLAKDPGIPEGWVTTYQISSPSLML